MDLVKDNLELLACPYCKSPLRVRRRGLESDCGLRYGIRNRVLLFLSPICSECGQEMEIIDKHPEYLFSCPECGTQLKDRSSTPLEGLRARLRKPVRNTGYVWAKRVKHYVNITSEMFRQRRREITSLIHRGDVVLDIGVGPGIILPEIAQRCGSKGKIIAMDISTRVLLQARRNVSDPSMIPKTCIIEGLTEEESNIELTITAPPRCQVLYVRGDAEHLPIVSEGVDFVYSSISLNYTNLQTSIPEISSVLKKGGRAYITLPSWSTRWALEMLSMPPQFSEGFPEWFMPDLYSKLHKHFDSFIQRFSDNYPDQLELSEMGWTWHEHPLFYYISWKEGEIGDEEFRSQVEAWEKRVSGDHDDEKVSIHPPPQKFVHTIIDQANQLGLITELIQSTPQQPKNLDSRIRDQSPKTQMFWAAHTNLRRENLAILRKPNS